MGSVPGTNSVSDLAVVSAELSLSETFVTVSEIVVSKADVVSADVSEVSSGSETADMYIDVSEDTDVSVVVVVVVGAVSEGSVLASDMTSVSVS